MTEREIIKALKRIVQYSGFTDDVSNTLLSALDLINRQQAEIERLQKKANIPFAKITFEMDKLQEIVNEYVKNIEIDINLAKSEAIKEFAERLKAYAKELHVGDNISWLVLGVGRIDQLVKEMTEEDEKNG